MFFLEPPMHEVDRLYPWVFLLCRIPWLALQAVPCWLRVIAVYLVNRAPTGLQFFQIIDQPFCFSLGSDHQDRYFRVRLNQALRHASQKDGCSG